MRRCLHCGTENADGAQYCANCGETLPEIRVVQQATKAQNGWLGAGVGCASYLVLWILLAASAMVRGVPPQAQSAIVAIIVILFLVAVVMLAVRNRRPGWLTGFLIVLLLPLGLFGACVGILTLSTAGHH